MSKGDLLTGCLGAASVTILSVGSGDGSQQSAIVKRGHSRIVTTFFDSKTSLLRKYPFASATLKFLEDNSFRPPLYEIDATKLDKQKWRENIPPSFDLIMFTFPHTGVSNNNQHSVQSNQDLLKKFLESASKILAPNGQIQITLKNGEHYAKWGVQTLLQTGSKVVYTGSHTLDKSLFPGYVHRLTTGALGPLKEVPDHLGAKVHVFAAPSASPASMVSSLVVLQPPLDICLWDDKEIQAAILSLLESPNCKQPIDVLEIRRSWSSPKPDTRSCNRVLYRLENDYLVKRHEPSSTSTNRKPRWSIMDTLAEESA